MISRKSVVRLLAVAGVAAASNMGYAQAIHTPFSPNEAGPAVTPAEEAGLQNMQQRYTDASSTRMAPSAQGATTGEVPSGTLSGGSFSRLPQTPDASWDTNRIGD
jgi:hypothetical protein